MRLFYGVLLFSLGQIIVWFQANGQFLWPFFKNNPWVISIVGGTMTSYVMIKGTELIYLHYDGLIWPGRFIGFSIGMIIFSYLTWVLMNEGITPKTLASILVAILLIGIQIFWK